MLAKPQQEIAKYDAMCRAIDAAYEVDEVKDIRDKAVAWEHYARQAKNTEAERRACEIRLRAERKAGQILATMEKAKAGRPPKGKSVDRGDRLSDLGISKDQSSDWQKLGAVSQDEFDAALDQAERPTTAGIIRATSEPKVTPVSRDALWLWGRLRDFREFVLDKAPSEVMETMTPEMLDETHELAPQVSQWLRKIGSMK